LQGIDPKAATDIHENLYLDKVYTALRTIEPEAHEKLQRGEAFEKEARYLSALDQLNQHACLVLLGDPGSGKTTFVNFVALCQAGEALEDQNVNFELLTAPLAKTKGEEKTKAQSWRYRNLIPVKVILRDFAVRGLPPAGEKASAEHLWKFISDELQSHTMGEYAPHLKAELQKEGGLLLFDGLDEVAEAERRRARIKEAVEDFKKAFSKCRFLITSRTYAYQKQDWRLSGFKETVLASFRLDQIQAFIESWYAHVGSLRGWQKDKYEGSALLLKNAIAASERLKALAERPLLLTLMAGLHAWRSGTLPEKREELYAEAVDLLLERWESAKLERDEKGEFRVSEPSLSEWLKVDRQKVRQLLNELAYQAHAAQSAEHQGTADIPEGKLVSGLLKISNNPDVKPKRLIEYLSRRAGLLLPRGSGVYTPPHRTFQEYLAACYLTDHDFPDQIGDLACAEPNRWREVALLAAAKAAGGSASTIWSFVDYLCPENTRCAEKISKDLWGAQLAGQALAEMNTQISISPRNRPKTERVKQCLAEALSCGEFPAIERAAAGVNLAILDDPRAEVTTVDKMQFCHVPGGAFYMGDGSNEHRNETLNKGYWIARFPVTNAQYNAFVEAGGYQQEIYWQEAKEKQVWRGGKVKGWRDDEYRNVPFDYGKPFHLPNHPVAGVSWYEALAFSRWLSDHWREAGFIDKTASVKLPSEAEWEKAARGGEEIPSAPVICSLEKLSIDNCQLTINNSPKRRYPFGEKADPNRSNYVETGIGSSSAVGCFSGGAGPCGCEEMSGNVLEWCRSLYKDYPYKPGDGREDLQDSAARVLRGGAFDNNSSGVRCAARYGGSPGDRDGGIGFRVVLSPDSEL
jgi:formylglycine-generating enzyme required for sulfatase activity